jgi:hypothetical protein
MSVVPLPERRERLAALDVGSNSIRLLVADYGPHSGITIIDEDKEKPRLAAGVPRPAGSTGSDGPGGRGHPPDARRL